MCVLALEKEVEEPIVDFKDPDLCAYYRRCNTQNCKCEFYLAQCEDPSLWNPLLLLFFHPEYILTNGLPTAPEIINPQH